MTVENLNRLNDIPEAGGSLETQESQSEKVRFLSFVTRCPSSVGG